MKKKKINGYELESSADIGGRHKNLFYTKMQKILIATQKKQYTDLDTECQKLDELIDVYDGEAVIGNLSWHPDRLKTENKSGFYFIGEIINYAAKKNRTKFLVRLAESLNRIFDKCDINTLRQRFAEIESDSGSNVFHLLAEALEVAAKKNNKTALKTLVAIFAKFIAGSSNYLGLSYSFSKKIRGGANDGKDVFSFLIDALLYSVAKNRAENATAICRLLVGLLDNCRFEINEERLLSLEKILNDKMVDIANIYCSTLCKEVLKEASLLTVSEVPSFLIKILDNKNLSGRIINSCSNTLYLDLFNDLVALFEDKMLRSDFMRKHNKNIDIFKELPIKEDDCEEEEEEGETNENLSARSVLPENLFLNKIREIAEADSSRKVETEEIIKDFSRDPVGVKRAVFSCPLEKVQDFVEQLKIYKQDNPTYWRISVHPVSELIKTVDIIIKDKEENAEKIRSELAMKL